MKGTPTGRYVEERQMKELNFGPGRLYRDGVEVAKVTSVTIEIDYSSIEERIQQALGDKQATQHRITGRMTTGLKIRRRITREML